MIRAIGFSGIRPVVHHVEPKVTFSLFSRHLQEARSFATQVSILRVLVTEGSRAKVNKAILDVYKKEICGICEKPGVETPWVNSLSLGAHAVCKAKIRGAETILFSLLYDLFPSTAEVHEVHAGIIDIVKKQLAGRSILSALEDEERFKSILYSKEAMDFLTDKAVAATLKTLNKGADV